MIMTRLFRNIFLVLIVLFISCQSVTADDLTPAQKEACKRIKKSLGAKDVEPLNNNLYQYLTKDGAWGVANSNSVVVIPPAYSYIVYFPAHQGNSASVYIADKKGNKSSRSITVPTEPTSEAIWGFSNEKGAVAFDVTGSQIASFPNIGARYFGNYLFLEGNRYTIVYEALVKEEDYDTPHLSFISWYDTKGLEHGKLVRSDGTVVIPEIDRGSFYANDPYIIYIKESPEKVGYYGMKYVSNQPSDCAPKRQDAMSFDNQWVKITGNNKFVREIPPSFYYMTCYDGVWKVADQPSNNFNAPIVYEPESTKAATIRDPGEAFYVRSQFDDVLAYYSDEGLDAPWASYYSADALVSKRLQSQSRFELIVDAMEKGSGLPKNEQGVISDVNVIRQMLNMANALYDKYLDSGDAEFKTQAISGKEMTIYYLTRLNEYIDRYNKVRSHAAMVTSQEEQRQAALMSYFLNSFSNALNSMASSSGSSSRSRSYAPSGSSAMPSTGGGSSSATDNSNRKIFLKEQIADWRNKLRKAEKSYEQAMGSGDDSWQKKKVLESKQRTIDECANMIRQYESELNSLK